MPYANLVQQPCADKSELFCRLRDFICKRAGTYDYSASGIGWTLHDASYASGNENAPALNDWFVVFSPGERGNEDLFFRFVWVSGYIKIEGWLSWDSTVHTGAHQYNTSYNFYIADAGSYTLWIYGDLDAISMHETTNASYNYRCAFGKLANTGYDDTIAVSSAPVSAGTAVTIQLDMIPPDWSAGDKIYIRDSNGLEIITITSIGSSSIVANVSSSYIAGCKLQKDIGYHCQSSYYNFSMACVANRTTGAVAPCYSINANINGYANPDELNGYRGAVPIHIVAADGYYGQLRHTLLCDNSSMTDGDVLIAQDGTMYRYLQFYTSAYCLVKEV